MLTLLLCLQTQRLYGFAFCLGLALLFGTMVGHTHPTYCVCPMTAAPKMVCVGKKVAYTLFYSAPDDVCPACAVIFLLPLSYKVCSAVYALQRLDDQQVSCFFLPSRLSMYS